MARKDEQTTFRGDEPQAPPAPTMDLRDFFAAAAITGMVQRWTTTETRVIGKGVAMAYAWADAALAARAAAPAEAPAA